MNETSVGLSDSEPLPHKIQLNKHGAEIKRGFTSHKAIAPATRSPLSLQLL
jgi:hypothetical protein